MREEIKYTIELKIDEGTYSYSMPYGAPVSAGVDAAMHFYLILKQKLDDYHKKLEEEGKAVKIKTDDDCEDCCEEVVEEVKEEE